MESPTLYLIKQENSDLNMPSRFSTLSTSKLWENASNTELHLFLKEPALLELARRGDSRILDLCEKLLTSLDPDEHFLALQILATFGTQQSIERLLLYCVNCIPACKKAALHALATTLTPEYIDYFTKIVTPYACTGVLDITAWTQHAITALEKICQRKSIRVVPMFHNRVTNLSSPSIRIHRPHATMERNTESQELKNHLEAI